MVGQEELHHTLTRLLDHGGVGLDLHVGTDGHGARGNGLGGLLDLDQAHAAVASNGQPLTKRIVSVAFPKFYSPLKRPYLVVAEARDFDASKLAGGDNGRARGHSNLLSIDLELDKRRSCRGSRRRRRRGSRSSGGSSGRSSSSSSSSSSTRGGSGGGRGQESLGFFFFFSSRDDHLN